MWYKSVYSLIGTRPSTRACDLAVLHNKWACNLAVLHKSVYPPVFKWSGTRACPWLYYTS
ncbi:hypothetical protein F383_19920 [Gossypium arboreum]|uniref:Uncharacterized protein n=1 Tax=Gossypium arboreum TaxID=29729 RepID=A0A0B0MIS7_GOSAR|nr:hypothetical protein F383_19920 [Gossypium arboreum]